MLYFMQLLCFGARWDGLVLLAGCKERLHRGCGGRARNFPAGFRLAEVTNQSSRCSYSCWVQPSCLPTGDPGHQPDLELLIETQAGNKQGQLGRTINTTNSALCQQVSSCQGWGNQLWFSCSDTTGGVLLFFLQSNQDALHYEAASPPWQAIGDKSLLGVCGASLQHKRAGCAHLSSS